MKDRYNFDDASFDDIIDEQCYNECLSEEDFYPPYDNRHLKSNVKNIVDGDNFVDYCKYFFNILEENDYYN